VTESLFRAHWAAEVANALLMGVRRKRIKPEQPQQLWEELGRLPIDTEPALILTTARGKEVLALGEKHGITVYDAAYLELARRYGLPLATLDGDLRKAAQAEGVPLL
jgi:predicted nucleic acid-binding protein